MKVRIVAGALLAGALVLAGCAPTSPPDIARDLVQRWAEAVSTETTGDEFVCAGSTTGMAASPDHFDPDIWSITGGDGRYTVYTGWHLASGDTHRAYVDVRVADGSACVLSVDTLD